MRALLPVVLSRAACCESSRKQSTRIEHAVSAAESDVEFHLHVTQHCERTMLMLAFR